jgi:hypothetical protein
VSDNLETLTRSTFGQRFEFARDRQRVLGTWQDDQTFADKLEMAKSQISEYKSRVEAPPVHRTLAVAKACGVDPGWLAFGEDTHAPSPAGFMTWLQNKYAPLTQANRAVRVEQPDVPAPRPSAHKKAAAPKRKRA